MDCSDGYQSAFSKEVSHYQNIDELSTDGVLRYIDEMLMEEDMDDDTNQLLESSDFHAKERSFYEVLGQEYLQQEPPSHRFSNEVQDPNDTKPVTSGKNNHLTNDEFDTWTCVDAGTSENYAAYISDLRNESNQLKKQSADSHGAFDLRHLLISCAQAIVSDNHHGVKDILRELRLHASQFGDANQRVAHYMVLGLEARFSGLCGRMQKPFPHERLSASDYFRVYCTSFISSSFRRISVFASNKLIANQSKKSAKLHIVDFGILYGFQWSALIQQLAERRGGPPKLRITGIDFPMVGFETVERIKDTGNRLAQYAEMFGVPFEYNAVLKSWESVRVEDLAIEDGEFVAVNCLYRSEHLSPDEIIPTLESPRSKVMELIKVINPDIFVHGVVNAGYGAPYFMSRFREALYHYSALFDMAETIIPKDRPERVLLESVLGNQVMNVVACEGWERVERPETCSQWQQRHVRAGLKQVRFERKVSRSIMKKVRYSYHRDFVVVEDKKWLKMSWKGRTICALSCWQPVAAASKHP